MLPKRAKYERLNALQALLEQCKCFQKPFLCRITSIIYFTDWMRMQRRMSQFFITQI